MKAREDYETQVEKALKDYGSSIKESDRQQLKLILRQLKNELREARAWIKNSMTIVANCNTLQLDAKSNAREAVNNPNMIASTRQKTIVDKCNRASIESQVCTCKSAC